MLITNINFVTYELICWLKSVCYIDQKRELLIVNISHIFGL